jgi:hypothetical protein
LVLAASGTVVWSGEAIGAFPPESQGLGDCGIGVGTHVSAVFHCAVALTMQLCGLRGKCSISFRGNRRICCGYVPPFNAVSKMLMLTEAVLPPTLCKSRRSVLAVKVSIVKLLSYGVAVSGAHLTVCEHLIAPSHHLSG